MQHKQRGYAIDPFRGSSLRRMILLPIKISFIRVFPRGSSVVSFAEDLKSNDPIL